MEVRAGQNGTDGVVGAIDGSNFSCAPSAVTTQEEMVGRGPSMSERSPWNCW
jgi:hypothetical protein